MREQLFEVRFAVLMNALRPTRKKEFVQKLLKEASFRNGWPYKFRLIHSHLISLFHLTHSHTSHPPGQLHSRPLHHGQLNHRACAEWDSNHHGCRDPTTTRRGSRYGSIHKRGVKIRRVPGLGISTGGGIAFFTKLMIGLFANLLFMILIPNFVRLFRATISS